MDTCEFAMGLNPLARTTKDLYVRCGAPARVVLYTTEGVRLCALCSEHEGLDSPYLVKLKVGVSRGHVGHELT
jgi:hypothetical protein